MNSESSTMTGASAYTLYESRGRFYVSKEFFDWLTVYNIPYTTHYWLSEFDNEFYLNYYNKYYDTFDGEIEFYYLEGRVKHKLISKIFIPEDCSDLQFQAIILLEDKRITQEEFETLMPMVSDDAETESVLLGKAIIHSKQKII